MPKTGAVSLFEPITIIDAGDYTADSSRRELQIGLLAHYLRVLGEFGVFAEVYPVAVMIGEFYDEGLTGL